MARAFDMERWYFLSGRYKKRHRLHGFYTGLGKIGPKLDKQYELQERMLNAYNKRFKK
mgnify:CR=1 FL=1